MNPTTGRWRIANRAAKTPKRARDCGRHPDPSPYGRRAPVGHKDTSGVHRSSSRRVGRLIRANGAHGSCCNRRVIQPTTVGPPAVSTNTRSCAVLARARFRCHPAQPRVGAMTVKVTLEIKELQLQIISRPEQRAVETFAADRADQPFDKWMRQWRVRHRLDGFHVKDSQIRLPIDGNTEGQFDLVRDPGTRRLSDCRWSDRDVFDASRRVGSAGVGE